MSLDEEMEMDSTLVCDNLKRLEEIWPDQHEVVYLLAQKMIPHLVDERVKPSGFVGSVAVAAFDVDDPYRNSEGMPDGFPYESFLDVIPILAEKTCPHDFAKQVQIEYDAVK